MQADLFDPTSIPATLVGVHTIIDCATARPEENADRIDWEGKKALIQSAQAMGIQKYVFCSIANCHKHPEVPLMNIKKCTEEFLEASGMNFTILRLCGFHQAIIGNYAVPILEEKPVWGTDDDTRTAYLDTVDLARMVLASLRAERASNAKLTLAGPKSWSTNEARPAPAVAVSLHRRSVARIAGGAACRPCVPAANAGSACTQACVPDGTGHACRDLPASRKTERARMAAGDPALRKARGLPCEG